jgi:hypothetical protein
MGLVVDLRIKTMDGGIMLLYVEFEVATVEHITST